MSLAALAWQFSRSEKLNARKAKNEHTSPLSKKLITEGDTYRLPGYGIDTPGLEGYMVAIECPHASLSALITDEEPELAPHDIALHQGDEMLINSDSSEAGSDDHIETMSNASHTISQGTLYTLRSDQNSQESLAHDPKTPHGTNPSLSKDTSSSAGAFVYALGSLSIVSGLLFGYDIGGKQQQQLKSSKLLIKG
jgi:hypothetical protein